MTTAGQRLELLKGAVAWRVVGSTAIVLDLRRSEYLEFNQAACLMMEMIAAGTSLADIVGELEQQYDVSAEQAMSDATELIDEMSSRGWLASAS